MVLVVLFFFFFSFQEFAHIQLFSKDLFYCNCWRQIIGLDELQVWPGISYISVLYYPFGQLSVHLDHLLFALAFFSFDAWKFDASSHLNSRPFSIIKCDFFPNLFTSLSYSPHLYLSQNMCLQSHIARYTWVENNYTVLLMLYYRIERPVKAYGLSHKL